MGKTMEMDYSIRDYRMTDSKQLMAIGDNWSEGIRSILEGYDPNNNCVERCYVAVKEERIIGFVFGYVLPRKVLIPHFLYVLTEYRKCGIGNSLLCKIEEESGCDISQIYFEKHLGEYYSHLGYTIGENLCVAIKTL